MNTKVYNQEGSEVGTVDLNSDVFGIEPNEAVVHQYVVNYLARQRQGNAATKTRSDVRGGGRKPFRQKGTGRARSGTSRSPVTRGGGTVFGPHPRSYGSKFPRQMKKLAICSVLSDKAKAERIRVIDRLELEEFKTKAVVSLLTKLEINDQKCLILDEGANGMNLKLAISCRNIPEVLYNRAGSVNGYDLLNADYILMTRAGLDKVVEVFS